MAPGSVLLATDETVLPPAREPPVAAAAAAAASAAEHESPGPPRLALAVGVRDVHDWRLASGAGFVPDAFMSHHWVIGANSDADVAWVIDRLADVALATRTDAILHYYYWGDHNHRRECFESAGACAFGSRALGTADWLARAELIGALVAQRLPPERRVIVVVETEFNNAAEDIALNREWWGRDFVRLMEDASDALKRNAGGRVETAVSVGAWSTDRYELWRDLFSSPRFDYAGTQTSGNHEADGDVCPVDDYSRLFDDKTRVALEALRRVSGDKPLGVWDVFVSSHGATGEADQARFYRDVAAARSELEALGVRWVAARSLVDNDEQFGCLGEDERHFGLWDRDEARWKLAFVEWRDAFAAPRAAPGRIEAEALSLRSGGGAVAHPLASGGVAWSLPPGGHARHTFAVPSGGDYRVTSCVLGEDARAEISVNGRLVWGSAATAAWAPAGGPVALAAGEDAAIVVRAVGDHPLALDTLELVREDAWSKLPPACGPSGSLPGLPSAEGARPPLPN